jgi:hypothetical protein
MGGEQKKSQRNSGAPALHFQRRLATSDDETCCDDFRDQDLPRL